MPDFRQPGYDHTEQDLHSRTASAAPCPPLNLLLAVGQDVLPPDVEQQVTAHIQTCGLCQMLIKDFADLPEANLTVLHSADIRATIPRPQHVAGEVRSHTSRSVFAIAAMVLFALCGFAAYRAFHQPTAPPLVAVVEAPKRITPFEKLAPPDMALDMGSRGSHHQAAPSADQLLPAFTAYNSGDYATAQTAFATLAQQYPKSDLPLLYLGVTDLLLGKNREAADVLSKADTLAAPTRKEHIAWYRALAAQRTDDPSTNTMFSTICAAGGTYSARACSLTK